MTDMSDSNPKGATLGERLIAIDAAIRVNRNEILAINRRIENIDVRLGDGNRQFTTLQRDDDKQQNLINQIEKDIAEIKSAVKTMEEKRLIEINERYLRDQRISKIHDNLFGSDGRPTTALEYRIEMLEKQKPHDNQILIDRFVTAAFTLLTAFAVYIANQYFQLIP